MKGVDILGLGSRFWPVKRTIKHVPAGLALGCFWNTFGPVQKNLKALLDTKKYPAVRIHAWWSNAHKIVPKGKLKKICKKVNKLSQQYPDVTFYLSHSCEHYEANVIKVAKRIEIIKKLAPYCIPVNCPSGSGARVPGCITERHDHRGNLNIRQPYIVSTDGQKIKAMNIRDYVAFHKGKAKITFVWCYAFNLKSPGEDSSIPPKQRIKAPQKVDFRRAVRCLT